MNEFFNDDKTLIIICITLISSFIIFGPPINDQVSEIIKLFGSGLFGMAVGKALK